MHFELTKGEFLLSTDPARLDIDAIYEFLSQTYWARNRPREVFDKALRNSICFGVYFRDQQIGFARAISDRATVGYLADVYILEPYRRRGLAVWLIQSILGHPELKELRRWVLLTADMHALYCRCGFTAPAHPEHYMEKIQPYKSAPAPEPTGNA